MNLLNKRGLSEVITVLIIILIIFVAIMIIWIVLRNLLLKQSELGGAQAQLFQEDIRVQGIRLDGARVNLSLKNFAGKMKTYTEGQEILASSADVISVVSLSRSMAKCAFVNNSCCTNSLNASGHAIWRRIFPSYSWASCTGELDTCDLGFNEAGPHWALLNLSSEQAISNVTLWWAWNEVESRYMTSQHIDIQYWNGSSYQNIASIDPTIFNITNSSITFSPITTTSIRLWQPANMGAPNYDSVMWLSEIELGSIDTSSALVGVSSSYVHYNYSVGGQGHHKNYLIDGINNPHLNPSPPPPTIYGKCEAVSTASLDNCTNVCGGSLITTPMLVDKIRPVQRANQELINVLFAGAENRIGLSAYRDIIDVASSNNLTNVAGTLNSKITLWEAYESIFYQDYSLSCICCGINDAVSKFQSSPSSNKKVIIVMSDGQATVGCGGNPIQDAINAACAAAASNITIHAVGVGAGVNRILLQNISNCGNGNFYYSQSGDINELSQIYRTIAQQIQTHSESIRSFGYLLFAFYNNQSQSARIRSDDIPNVLEIENYEFDLNGILAPEIIKIEVYPVIISSLGEEIIGPVLDSWEKR